MSSSQDAAELRGVISVLKRGFGFIKCPELATDVFFHANVVGSTAGPAAAGGTTGAGNASAAPAAAAARQDAGGSHAASTRNPSTLAVGDPVTFVLSPDSRPGKLVAARVPRQTEPPAAGACAAPSASGAATPQAPAPCQPGPPRCVGIVAKAAAPPPAANAAWAPRLRNGLIRFVDAGGAVRHVAFGAADVGPPDAAAAAIANQCEGARPPTASGSRAKPGEAPGPAPHPPVAAPCQLLAEGTAVTFTLFHDEGAAARQRRAAAAAGGGHGPTAPAGAQAPTLLQPELDPRAAFWEAHGARGVAALSEGDEARLPAAERSQLAVLRLVGGALGGSDPGSA